MPFPSSNEGKTSKPDKKGTTHCSSRAVTLEDVAKLAGVSPITVSRVLNQPGIVALATIEKVQNAISQTGYVPSLLAGRAGFTPQPPDRGHYSIHHQSYLCRVGTFSYRSSTDRRIDRAEIGRRAALALLERINEKTGIEKIIDLGFGVKERATTLYSFNNMRACSPYMCF